jgi:hypothetical protein
MARASRSKRSRSPASPASAAGRNLDRDQAIEPGIAPPIHFAHAPRADEGDDFVGTELCPRRQRQQTGPDYSLITERAGSLTRTRPPYF